MNYLKLVLFCFHVLALFGIGFAQTNFWQPTGTISGAWVFSLAVDSTGNIYAGTDTSGLFRSTDNGSNWVPTTVATSPILALTVSSNGDIFAGGEGGVYRSTDNGNTWNPAGLTTHQVEALTISANGIILAGTGAGIYRSTDNGANWTYTGLFLFGGAVSLAFGSSGYAFAGGGNDTLFRSTDNGNSWIITSFAESYIKALITQPDSDILAGAVGGLHRSTDNGYNWSQVGLPNIQVLSLAANYHNHIFAGTVVGGVFRSTNNGTTWEQINSGLTNLTIFALAINRQGYIFAGNGAGVFRSVQSTTSVREIRNEKPLYFSLAQNYPNPFNPKAMISYSLPAGTRHVVSLRVFDILGREVRTLVDERQDAGYKNAEFDGSDLPSGVYLYRLWTESYVSTKKMLLLK